MASCGSTAQNSDRGPDRTTAPKIEIDWSRCGLIECGQIEVPVDHVGQQVSGAGFDAPTVRIAVFRRKAIRKGAPALVMLPDRRFGMNARALVENAPLEFGSQSSKFTLISMAPRGSFDSPMPAGQESGVSTLDQVDDLETLRNNLGAKKLSVMGWGSGATVATTWAMTHPRRVSRLVVDSPQDPTVSLTAQALLQVASVRAAVNSAFLWCASHLSCPMNINVAKYIGAFKSAIRRERVPTGTNLTTVARAGTTTLANGDALLLFRSIGATLDGDATSLLALAGVAPTIADAYAPCADTGRKMSAHVAKVFREYSQEKTRQFTIGTEADVYGMCAQLPEPMRTLWGLTPDAGSTGLAVYVTVARGDPVIAPSVPRAMAKKMGWAYKSVRVNRHLVVGYDEAATDDAFAFLSGD